MIVKVQVSLFASDGVQTVLIYNKDKSICIEHKLNKGSANALRGRPKAFFECTIAPDGLPIIDHEVEDPGW